MTNQCISCIHLCDLFYQHAYVCDYTESCKDMESEQRTGVLINDDPIYWPLLSPIRTELNFRFHIFCFVHFCGAFL